LDGESQRLLDRSGSPEKAGRTKGSPEGCIWSSALVLRKPTTGIAGCCARTVRGHAAALLSAAMNSRRRSWIAIGRLLIVFRFWYFPDLMRCAT
jgi:hypothetical protein